MRRILPSILCLMVLASGARAASSGKSARTSRPVDQPLPPREGELLKGLIPDGLRLFIWYDPELEDEEVCLTVGVGSAFDMEHKQGAAAMAADILAHGHSGGVAASELAAAWERNGYGLRVIPDEDAVSYQITLTHENLRAGLGAFGQLVARCEVRDEDFAAAMQRARLRYSNSLPWSQADSALRRELYQQYSYHRVPTGTPENFSNLTREIVRGYYSQYCRPNNSVLVMAGPVPPEEARQIALKAFADWQYGYIPPANPNPPPPLDHWVREEVPGIEGTGAALGGAMVPHASLEDAVALRVWTGMIEPLGDSSRMLWTRQSSFRRHKLCDEVRISWTAPDSEIMGSAKEWRDVPKDSLPLWSRECFDVGRDAAAEILLSSDSWARVAARAALFGWPVDTPDDLRRLLAALTPESVAAAVRRLIPEDRWALVLARASRATPMLSAGAR